MSRLRLLALLLVGLAFPAGLGLAVYVASGSTFVSPAATARVPTGSIGRPSTPPVTTDEEHTDTDRRGRCDEEEHRSEPECVGQATTTGETTTGVTTTAGETTTERETTTSDDRDSDDRDSGSSGSRSSGSGRTGRDGSGSSHSGSDGDD